LGELGKVPQRVGHAKPFLGPARSCMVFTSTRLFVLLGRTWWDECEDDPFASRRSCEIAMARVLVRAQVHLAASDVDADRGARKPVQRNRA
jgi:hypothetical protein